MIVILNLLMIMLHFKHLEGNLRDEDVKKRYYLMYLLRFLAFNMKHHHCKNVLQFFILFWFIFQ
jgi:hypothetical protein